MTTILSTTPGPLPFDVDAYLREMGDRMVTTTTAGEFSAISHELASLCAVAASPTDGPISRVWADRSTEIGRAAQTRRCPTRKYRRSGGQAVAHLLEAGAADPEAAVVRLAVLDVLDELCRVHADTRDLPRDNDGWAVWDRDRGVYV